MRQGNPKGRYIEGEIGKGNTHTKSLQVSLELYIILCYTFSVCVCVCMLPPLQLPLSSYQSSREGGEPECLPYLALVDF